MKVEKVVGNLPSTLAADTIYAVRVGLGFDLHFSDGTGSVAHTLNVSSGSSGLPVPDDIDESGSLVWHYGWLSQSGGWLIQRMTRATGSPVSATVSNNSGVTDYASAWTGRAALVYT